MADDGVRVGLYKTKSGVCPAGGGTATQFIPADPTRLVLIFSCSTSGGNQGFWMGGTDPNSFHFVVTSAGPVRFSYKDDGDIVFLPVFTDGQFPTGITYWISLNRI